MYYSFMYIDVFGIIVAGTFTIASDERYEYIEYGLERCMCILLCTELDINMR